MRKTLFVAAAAAFFAAPFVSNAAEPAHGEIYYSPSTDIEVKVPNAGKADDDGDGWGGKVFLPFGYNGNFVVTAEYDGNSYDDSDMDMDQFRIGGGWQTGTDLLSGGIFGEYISNSMEYPVPGGRYDFDSDGYGVHARISGKAADRVRLYAQGGYVSLDTDDDSTMDGPEFLVGASVDITPMFGLYADYRHTELKGDDNVKTTFDDVRTGVQFRFGGGSF